MNATVHPFVKCQTGDKGAFVVVARVSWSGTVGNAQVIATNSGVQWLLLVEWIVPHSVIVVQIILQWHIGVHSNYSLIMRKLMHWGWQVVGQKTDKA